MTDVFDHDDDSDLHVMPVNDLREHEMSLSCWCRPRRDVSQIEVVVHNSLDGRERIFETGYLN